MAAFSAAVDAGYGIELDLQLTADEKALVFHDYDLSRLTSESGLVRNRRASDFATIALLGGTTGPPVLEEVLAAVDGKVPLLIELKDQDGALGEDVGALETATAQALTGYTGPVALMSFNPHSVAALQTLAPHIPRGLVTGYVDQKLVGSGEYCDALNRIAEYERVGACFVSHFHRELDVPRVKDLRQSGAKILCWTVRSQEEEAAARAFADNVTFEGYLPGFPS